MAGCAIPARSSPENEVIFSVLATTPDPLADDLRQCCTIAGNHAPDDVLAAIAYRWLTTVG